MEQIDFLKIDRIVIDFDTFQAINNWGSKLDMESQDIQQFLNEAIIEFDTKLPNEDMVKIELYFNFRDNGIFFKIINRPIEFLIDENGSVSIDCLDMTREGVFDELSIEESKEVIFQSLSFIVNSFSYIMSYIEQIQADPNVISVTKERRHITKKPRGRKGKSRKISFSRTIYTFDKFIALSKRSTFIRHKESWGVRGHFRHYKDGKITFIKPYTKGSGKRLPKHYVINSK
ncbi:hypothetical protein [Paenibacillus sp. FSL K6-2524]|uniref:hypothetical protein n=1 Tax=Paenibacillus sp. FSL K6-2524 TaxID=2954516 RepID=UPI0030FCE7CA